MIHLLKFAHAIIAIALVGFTLQRPPLRLAKPRGASVTTLAGSPYSGFIDSKGPKARFDFPRAVAIDRSGNVFVADTLNHRIRKVGPDGTVTTLAGNRYPGIADGKGSRAQFNHPQGVAVDAVGNVIVADTDNDRIRKIAPDGTVTTVAGSTMGYRDGKAFDAQFDSPYAVAVDDAGNMFVADGMNGAIRKISTNGMVTTIAGGNKGSADGQRAKRKPNFDIPTDVAVDGEGSIWVVDSGKRAILKIRSDRAVQIVFTQKMQRDMPPGLQDYTTIRIAADRRGNLFFTDSNRVLKIGGDGKRELIAGFYAGGFRDGRGRRAQFNNPTGIAVDSKGIIYVADTGNHAIRRIDPLVKDEPKK